MLQINNKVGAYAINSTSPAGQDPREGENYSAVQAEIDKLNSIHASENVDWQKLSTLCTEILTNEGKDLHVSIWLLCAWARLRGLPGLVDGVQVLKDVVTLYWDNMTPPVSRQRARRNQAEWMLTWLDKFLDESSAPLSAVEVNHLKDNWEAIDNFWREKDAESPPFFRLQRRLGDIPVTATAADQKVVSEEIITANDENHLPIITATPSIPTVKEMSIAASSVAAPESLTALESGIEKVFESLAPLYAWCLDQHPGLPLFLRLNRQTAWLTLGQLPTSEGRITRLQPPPESQRNTLLQLLRVSEPVEIVRFCESRIRSFPWWLDLNRASHAALMQTGESQGANAIGLEIRHLIARLPGLTELTFADGMPFADGATQAWLEGLQPPVNNGTATSDELQLQIEVAGRTAADGDLNDALRALQQRISSTYIERDRFRLRVAQCALIHRFDPQVALYIPLESLLQQADELNLTQWEPELVKPLLEMMLDYSDQPEWSKRLAHLDLPDFWRLYRRNDSVRTDMINQ